MVLDNLGCIASFPSLRAMSSSRESTGQIEQPGASEEKVPGRSVAFIAADGPLEAPKPPDLEPGLIHSLPEELLIAILDVLHLSEIDAEPDSPKIRLLVPTIACQVSSFWRQLALNHLLWWSYIYIAPPWKFDAIQAYLHRSGGCPLDVRISVHHNYHALHEDGVELPSLEGYLHLGPILFPHLSRCRSLTLHGVFRDVEPLFPHLITPLISLDMPHLEELTIDCDFKRKHGDVTKPLFQSAPRLFDVRLGGLSVASFRPPFSNIRSLHLSRATDNRNLSFLNLKDILASCECLTTLAIYDDFLVTWPGMEAERSCSVPLLESLYILGNMLAVSELLLFLSAPNLRELVIAPVVAGDFTNLVPHADLSNGLPRFPALAQLTVAPAFSDTFNETLPSASRCFPNVQTLILANVYLVEFGQSFVDNPMTLFPKMENLALTDVDKAMARAVQLVAKVRKMRGSPLKNVYVDSDSVVKFMDVEDDWEGVNVQVADLWENQRRKAMYRDVKDLFIGRPSDEIW